MKKRYIVPIFIMIVLMVCCTFVGCKPKTVVDNNSWLAGEKGTLISAHRGGSLYPENTLMAFDYCLNTLNYVDIIELDVRTTVDGKLVIMHDETINRVAVASGLENVAVSSKTVEELRQYNLGYNFADEQGQYPYRELSIGQAAEQGLTISTLEEFLDRYADKNFRVYIEIKEKGGRGIAAAEQVLTILKKEQYSGYTNRYMIISFDNDVIDFVRDNYPEVARGPLGTKVQGFVVSYMFGVSDLSKPDYTCIQLPTSYKVAFVNISLAKKRMVNKLHARNMAITYWTVDDAEEMKKLVDIGADVITTNKPETLYNVLKEKGLR